MKRKTITHAARLLCVLALAMTMTTAAFAADPPEPAQPSPCYPTAVTPVSYTHLTLPTTP